MKKYKTLIIINPISGTGKQNNIGEKIEKYINKDKFEYNIKFTEYRGHGDIIAKQAIEERYELVIAIGGDGTINEIARSINGTDVGLGIIACGSGNGLARHLGIPLNVKKAILHLNESEFMFIDSMNIENKLSFNVSGLGFDGLISHEFDKMNNRGLLSYMKACVKCFFNYKEQNYFINYDEFNSKEKAMMISIANSSQFGNNASIAPQALIDDGYMNLIILRKPKLYQIPILIILLFLNKINKSKLYKEIVCKKAEIKVDKIFAHIDGDPIELNDKIKIKILKHSLKIMNR
ncbi:MAG: YegS/Rv2252/BmrU family lipid kinase [Marinifilaceae bacterium]|nr:YegS/Rv2252/BmrU family lipid kinase [Marinifilaceae bacterium]